MKPIELRHFVSATGKDIFQSWLDKLGDPLTRARVEMRLLRLARGLLGDCKAVGAGVMELRLDFGPGYRVYFAKDGDHLVLLLCGGDKSSQQKDIEHAINYWKIYQARGE